MEWNGCGRRPRPDLSRSTQQRLHEKHQDCRSMHCRRGRKAGGSIRSCRRLLAKSCDQPVTLKAPEPKEFDMSSTQARSETAIATPSARKVDMKLEVVVIPVSDVDRAQKFYASLGWRLDADFAGGDDFRVIQFTPPGSGSSVIFGKNVTAAA